jgi:propionate CoA-transferase
VRNYDALIEQSAQFDFYDGGGLDIAFLSFAEVDGDGNVNVSRFNGNPNGSGGFIHIAQNARAVCFLGTLTAGGLRVGVADGAINIEREGEHRRFVAAVGQRTYDRRGGVGKGQRVRYITERAVLEPVEGGLMLIEIAPGVDLERDVLANFDVRPLVSPLLTKMPAELFREAEIGLRARFAAIPGRMVHWRLLDLVASERRA